MKLQRAAVIRPRRRSDVFLDAPTLVSYSGGTLTVDFDVFTKAGDVLKFYWTVAAAPGATPDGSYTVTEDDEAAGSAAFTLSPAAGSYDLEAIHFRGTRYSAVSNTLPITVAAASSPTEVGYSTASFTSPDGIVNTFTIATTGLTAHAGGTFDIQDGDVLVLAINAVTSGALTPSVADAASVTWATRPVVFGDDNNDSNLVLAITKVNGTPPASFTITTSAAVANSTAVILKVLRGYENVWDVTPVTASSPNDDAADPGAITPTTANALVGAIYAASNSTASSNTFVGLGPSTDWDNYIALRAGGGSTRHALLAMQTRIWTSGAIDPPAIDPGISASTAFAWTATTFAIPPET